MFSVIIPYYKKRLYIERCLKSVFNQTYLDYEVILVDDGSNDDIEFLCKEKFPEVNLIKQKNKGVSAARNAGIDYAKRKYIAFLDADDYWSPYYLEKNAQLIQIEKNVGLIGSHYINQHSKLEKNDISLDYKKINSYFSMAIRNTLFLTSASIVVKKFFDYNPKFNTNLLRGEDTDVWFRIVLAGERTYYINNTLVFYSLEDQFQSTRMTCDIKNSLVGKAIDLYHPSVNCENNDIFARFIVKYVLLNLYSYYFHYKYHEEAKVIFKRLNSTYILLNVIYFIPYKLGNFLFYRINLKKYLRLYFKFITRFIYK
jgi:glycosyltransferase involved in cell wall biosynthesis